jgi:hypothetical protein
MANEYDSKGCCQRCLDCTWTLTKIFGVCFVCCTFCAAKGTENMQGAGVFGDDASGDARVNQSLVPAATGGALGDLPFLACAKMSRDEATRAEGSKHERV